MAVREDAWLSERLGKPVYSVDPGDALPGGPAMLQARVPAEDVEEVRSLSGEGLYVVDAALTLARGAGGTEVDGSVREAREEDRDAVLGIAAGAFRFSRFHLDPAIPDRLADGVKRAWMESYFEETRGDALLVSEDGGAITGFLGVIDRDEDSVIDLVAVAPEHHGRGSGRALCEAFLAREGPRRRVVGTQAANAPSLALYEALGFRVVSAAFNLHGHL